MPKTKYLCRIFNNTEDNIMLPVEKTEGEGQSNESREKPPNLKNNLLFTIQCPVTHLIFRRTAMLTGTNEVVELAVAQELMKTTKKGLDGRPITGYTVIFTLNSLIESYMTENPTAERYPEYPKVMNEKMPSAEISTMLEHSSTASSTVTVGRNSQSLFASPVHSANSRIILPQVMVVKPNNNKDTMKVLLIGDSNAGKIQLLSAGATDNFTPNFIATIGIDFKVINHNGTKFQCWDTAGQERFRSITSSYYWNADAIILMSSTSIHNWLADIQRNLSPDFKYYGIQYSEESLRVRSFTSVINQENPNDPPLINNFTDEVIGSPRTVNSRSEGLKDLFLSLLSNIKRLSSNSLARRLPERSIPLQMTAEDREPPPRQNRCTIS